LLELIKEKTWRKRGSQELKVVLQNFYVQLVPINLVFSLNWEVKLSSTIGLHY